MNCEQYRQLISALVDKELNEGERGSLDEHIAECSECAQYSEQIRELERLTAEWVGSSMPSDVEQAVLARTKTRPLGWLGRLWGGSYHIPRPVAWAAVLLFVLLAVNSWRGHGGAVSPDELIIAPDDLQPKVQKIILTQADIVQTYTTEAVPRDL